MQDDALPLSINVSIIPHSSREEASKVLLTTFDREVDSFDDLPKINSDAGTAMGLRELGPNNGAPTFARDVLRICVSGPTGLHLSVVDLPGIIQVPSEGQTDDDVEAVHSLVDSYMMSKRSIILAVVQAGNDISNQPVIRKCRQFDPSGERTIGVITKPDLINKTAEGRIAQLARNEDTTKLKLGFFLIKNPSPEETERGLTTYDREAIERDFFTSAPWKNQKLNPDRLGVQNLRAFLQELLERHIRKEIPKVRQELKRLERQTAEQLLMLGGPRKTTADLRIHLSRLAMKFDNICSSALQGNYDDSRFFGSAGGEIPPTRLRAIVHSENVGYANLMRTKGEKRRVGAREESDNDVESGSEADDGGGQILVTESAMKEWVKKRLEAFLDALVSHLTDEEHTRQRLREGILAALEAMKKNADEELNRLWIDEAQQPVTYNHYYTDNIQKARNDSARKALKKAMDETTHQDYGGRIHISNNNVDIQNLLGLLQDRIVVNMDEQACSEGRGALNAYYKVGFSASDVKQF
ncbi:hypothetical protein LTR78_007451 [Recurvomyces mirabilis]|uniref:Dynamin-type G domain-containing protein n=1 Tax=Recurvomyces mirabilis TaxID=574656 RepID=A0AAE0TU93_9PEZI|nr:hypothetical protein LTR78_007451 [Recurvomyces mirabilis]KAK5160040.1 hypothetical protein LTS14_002146 [Recurvomyces mirabilis]